MLQKLILFINSISKKNVVIYRIFLCAILIITIVVVNIYMNKGDQQINGFLKDLNLNISLKIIEVKPTNNHGYGVLYGEVLKSNKSNNYSAIYKNKYVFCKIKQNKILLISDYYVTKKNDVIVINSSKLKYRIYRNGKLDSENNLTFTTDFMLFRDVENDHLFDFKTYIDF